MSEQMLLIKFKNNYSDEFDVEGFKVMSDSKWKEHLVLAQNHFDDKAATVADPSEDEDSYYNDSSREVSVYFGTNEEIIYSDYKDYINSFIIKELSDIEYKVLKDLFGIHHKAFTFKSGRKTIKSPAYVNIECGMLAMINTD